MSDVIKNRHEIVFFIEAKNTNYNGDPDYDNLPRIDFENNHGYMTDVCIKRRIRDYIDSGYGDTSSCEIFVRDGVNLNKGIAECVVEASGSDKVEKGKKSIEASEVAKRRFYDVRTFGGVLTTGINAGQVQGAVQFDMPVSYDPVQVNTIALTRLAYSEKDFTEIEKYDEFDKTLPSDKKRTMGKKAFCNYALFECHAYVSANIAQKNGFNEDDLNKLLEAIMNMYSFQTSASKAGMSVVGPVIVFKHVGKSNTVTEAEQRAREAKLGCVAAHKLFKLINVHKKEGVEYPRDYTDYEASINVSNLPAGVEVGFKHDPFGEIEWHHLNEHNEWFKEL